MIKFRISIGIPGYLDAEDELSNLLQDMGNEEDLGDVIREAIKSWVVAWEPHLWFSEIKIKVEQE